MSVLGDIFKNAGVEQAKLVEVVKLLKENPMAAMAAVQALNLPEETIQQVMGAVMVNPAAIEDFARELGLSEDDLTAIKNQVNQS